VQLPSIAALRESMTNIESHLHDDPTGFREFMRTQFLEDGRIVMEPHADGSYLAQSNILPLRVAIRKKTKGPDFSGPLAPLAGVGCGGRRTEPA